MFWALLPRWAKIALLGSIVTAGGAFWLYRRAYQAGAAAERLKANEEAVRLASNFRAEKAAAVAAAIRAHAPAIQAANRLHDSVTVHDTVTLIIPGPSLTPVAVVVPAIVVRRIVADSVALSGARVIIATQAALIAADSLNITALTDENRTLRDMKAPVCGRKCRFGARVATVIVVGETVVRVVKALKKP